MDIPLNKIKQTPKLSGHTDSRVMNVQATVDVSTKQKLRKLRPFNSACLHLPVTMGSFGQNIAMNLISCFEKQKNIQEGQIKDILWGFSQSNINPAVTIEGLKEMMDAKLIKLQMDDNSFTTFESENVINAFIRYQPVFLEMMYEPINT